MMSLFRMTHVEYYYAEYNDEFNWKYPCKVSFMVNIMSSLFKRTHYGVIYVEYNVKFVVE